MAYADAEEEDNDREALPPIELPLIHSFLYSLLQILPMSDLEDDSDDENAEDIGPSRESIESVRAQMFRMIPARGYTIEPAWLRRLVMNFPQRTAVLLSIINGTKRVVHSLALISSWGLKASLASRYPTLRLPKSTKRRTVKLNVFLLRLWSRGYRCSRSSCV